MMFVTAVLQSVEEEKEEEEKEEEEGNIFLGEGRLYGKVRVAWYAPRLLFVMMPLPYWMVAWKISRGRVVLHRCGATEV